MNQFEIKDCTLLTRMSGLPPALNLRELRDRITRCRQSVLYHHFCETLLTPQFDYPDYRNDFAVWVKHQIDDNVLAERLGILDPYSFASLEDLRLLLLELIDEHLGELPYTPSAHVGHEFYFMEATTVAFDTGKRINRPEELYDAVIKMTPGSLYFHFFEARWRPPIGMDDFSAWLQTLTEPSVNVVKAFQSIDFSFFTLSEIKKEILAALSKAK